MEPAPLCPCHQGHNSPSPAVKGGDHLSQMQGSTLLLQCPARGKASFSRASEGFLWPLGWHRPQTSTQPSCSWTMDPDVALGSSLAPDKMTFWLQMEALATQIGMALVTAWSPGITKASGCSPNLDFSMTFGGNTELGLQHRSQSQ